ncbi:MAG TPA: carboxypeptidase-like regulatory domain-containing protein, partial [Vicinamibacterales bacterium]
MTFLRRAAILLVLVFLPSAVFAQAAITGVVKDTSGAVLPGATVEAASPVLIEKVRSVVSDATGQYRIVDLRPGTYSVTFTLPGFSTVKREGIELTGSFVATVNGELKVGALEETITVTGETPIV